MNAQASVCTPVSHLYARGHSGGSQRSEGRACAPGFQIHILGLSCPTHAQLFEIKVVGLDKMKGCFSD